jgi:hypothetical protein
MGGVIGLSSLLLGAAFLVNAVVSGLLFAMWAVGVMGGWRWGSAWGMGAGDGSGAAVVGAWLGVVRLQCGPASGCCLGLVGWSGGWLSRAHACGFLVLRVLLVLLSAFASGLPLLLGAGLRWERQTARCDSRRQIWHVRGVRWGR